MISEVLIWSGKHMVFQIQNLLENRKVKFLFLLQRYWHINTRVFRVFFFNRQCPLIIEGSWRKVLKMWTKFFSPQVRHPQWQKSNCTQIWPGVQTSLLGSLTRAWEVFSGAWDDPQTATSLTSLMAAWMTAFPQLHRRSFSPAVNLLPPVCDLAPPAPCVAGAEVHRWGTCRNLRWESDDLPTLSNKGTSIAHTHKASLVGNHSLSD